MGDSESEVERQLLKDSHVLESNIVKLGHHGSKSSTSIAFLDKVAADYAIVSCGKIINMVILTRRRLIN